MFLKYLCAFISLILFALVLNVPAHANDWWVDVRNDRVNKIIETIEQGKTLMSLTAMDIPL